MEATLKRLLEVENEAEQKVVDAKQQRERIIEHALQHAHELEAQFQDKIPEIYDDFNKKAQKRAEQSIAELHKRYSEKQTRLRELAQDNQHKALEAALHLLTRIDS